MILLEENNRKSFREQSSKGNQLKWEKDGIWYKADYAGYEGLAEYMVSHLLELSTLHQDEFVIYGTESIKYLDSIYNGCSSANFKKEDDQIITLERLHKNHYGTSFLETVMRIPEISDRLDYLVRTAEIMTGLKDFGTYLTKLLTIDAVFLNEDRHLHNIAVIMHPNSTFSFCPVFDNGLALLSDTSIDYASFDEEKIYGYIDSVKAKTISPSFNEALDATESKYGSQIRFTFTNNDIRNLLKKEKHYPEKTKRRVETILLEQRRKYKYLFTEE